MAAGKDAREQIVKAIPSAKVDAMELDLSSLSCVRKFASDFNSSGLPLNILMSYGNPFHAFEAWMEPMKVHWEEISGSVSASKDKIELQFATIHVGHFLLTNLLLDTMKKTARKSGKEGRIALAEQLPMSSHHPAVPIPEVVAEPAAAPAVALEPTIAPALEETVAPVEASLIKRPTTILEGPSWEVELDALITTTLEVTGSSTTATKPSASTAEPDVLVKLQELLSLSLSYEAITKASSALERTREYFDIFEGVLRAEDDLKVAMVVQEALRPRDDMLKMKKEALADLDCHIAKL
ncbi:uncharacterized protein LOC125468984 [Pyrus x bretschneideri]|uniref:uncharacterized protein LOC125468984 n=1 Tax=Pyrus x bretschneideri TaxID=225117 RepID=UPI00203044E9|nr:uncharacterized protein LOC125468984 [Pyrus x bretschneideri]